MDNDAACLVQKESQLMPATPTRSGEFFAGMRATIPLIIGAMPFGIIYGARALLAGLSPAATQAMSLFVFAGSAQFIGATLVSQGVTTAVIILTTFIVNLRHMLYSASLGPYVRGLSQKWLVPLGFWLTDESYAVVITRYARSDDSPHKHWFYLGSAVLMYTNWQICTFIGITAAEHFPGAANWGLDFAMTVTFIGIVVPLIRTRPALVCVVVSGAVALLTHPLPNKLGLMISALLGIAAGMMVEAWQPKPSPRPGTETQ
jgi:4-azaleucine resistance transporter AzlC